jgi:dolichyl-phosphate beta-glucosyltransferase
MTEPKPRLSLIMPAYNEELRLPPTLETLASWIPTAPFDVELIVVDDGSVDRTIEVVDSFRERIALRTMQVEHLGYMNAILSGLAASDRPLRATVEADCPVHPRELEKFLPYVGDHGVVMGSRVLRGGKGETGVVGKSFLRRIISAGMSRLFLILFRGGIRDPQIGFKLYTAAMVDKVVPELCLKHDGLKSSEMIVKALAFGFRVKEIPVPYRHDPDSKAVPKGNYRVIFDAAFAVFHLWAKSYVEYRRGDLPRCPVRFGFLMAPFWKKLRFPRPARQPYRLQ